MEAKLKFLGIVHVYIFHSLSFFLNIYHEPSIMSGEDTKKYL